MAGFGLFAGADDLVPDFYGTWSRAAENGRQRAADYTVRKHIDGALQGDQGAMGAILKASPDAGIRLREHVASQHAAQRKAAQEQQTAAREDAGRAAMMFSQTGDPQYYAMWRQSLSGLPNAPQLPDTLTPEDIEPAKQSAGAFARAYGGHQGSQVPSAVQELEYLLRNPQARALDMERRRAGWRPEVLTTNQGYAVFDPQTRGTAPLEYGQGSSQQTADPQQVFAGLHQAVPGLRVTSGLRTPEENARLPNSVPNSYHLTGQAIDIGRPTPEQRQQVAQWAAQNGFEVIDNYQDGHVHLEPRGGGRRVMPAPKASEKSEMDRRLELAQRMGATPDEQRRLVLGNAAPRTSDALGGKPLTQGTVNGLTKDAGKLENLKDLSARFDDDFAGNKITGGAENMLGRLGLPGATEGQSDWWQQYDRYKNEVRNELFGASLTSGEQRAFLEADITPNMAPPRVRANLTKQAEIIEKALRRKAATWAAQGYNKAAIEAATGIPLTGAQAPATQQSGGWAIKVKQ